MSDKLMISPKHGLNPCIPVCWFCGAEKEEVVLLGRLKDDAEAPRKAVLNQVPCDKCRERMAEGVILIGVRDGETGSNPYRTGQVVDIALEAAARLFPELDLKKNRACFIQQSELDKLIKSAGYRVTDDGLVKDDTEVSDA